MAAKVDRGRLKMLRFAHIINPVVVPETSDLWEAQPVTQETMRRARAFATGTASVELYSAQFAEDHPAVPDDFIKLPDLDRSVLDLGSFEPPRKLPLLRDILDRAYNATDAEFLIYSNVDIGVLPHFYLAVGWAVAEGHDAFTINRRTISKHGDLGRLPLIYSEIGLPHSGHDCFVFRRSLYPLFRLFDSCIGAPHVGRALLVNLMCATDSFTEFTDLHLTFHLGNDIVWKSPELADYRSHNKRALKETMAALRAEGRLGSEDPFR